MNVRKPTYLQDLHMIFHDPRSRGTNLISCYKKNLGTIGMKMLKSIQIKGQKFEGEVKNADIKDKALQENEV